MSQFDIENIIKIIVFFLISFGLDFIAIYYIGQYSTNGSEYWIWILAIALTIGEAGIYYVLIKPNLTSKEEYYGITQFVLPTFHFFVLVGISIYYLNNSEITYAMNYIITAGVIIGAVHLLLRLLKFQSSSVSPFGTTKSSGSGYGDVNKEKQTELENKMQQQATLLVEEIRNF